ncbi:hypothetical protein ACLK1T_09150 [Escherichia coli]
MHGVGDDGLSKGRLTGYKFYEAVTSSHARLTYTKVWHILQAIRICASSTPRWLSISTITSIKCWIKPVKSAVGSD